MVIEHYKDLQNRNTRPCVCGNRAGIFVWWYEKKSDSAFPVVVLKYRRAAFAGPILQRIMYFT